MDQILKLFSNTDQLLIAVALALILLGIITPKKFLGFEVDWTLPKSAAVLLIGLGLLGFSIWHSIDSAILAKEQADADAAREREEGMREGNVHAPARTGRPGN